ncbi:unnamed protein product [Caenorhabditis angaria]|uniref:Serpentine Receptor, class H n=1 Tax=Caenorhabditis angaria TaxID=860376 RepID=A0A9P1N9M4_9PELO|nr:unnamed protein product [Caenorhabditis angaria]
MIKVSPASMKSTVPYMIHLHIWTMTCDFMFAVLLCPMFFLPLLAGIPYGVLNYFKIPVIPQFWLAFAALGGMTCAVITLFEYRHRVIVTSSKFVMRRRSTRIIFNFFFYLYHINFGLPEILTIPENQKELKYLFLMSYPCPPEVYFHDDMFILQKDGTVFNPHMYFTCFTISCIAGFYVFHTLYTLLSSSNPNMSETTRKLQRSFFMSTLIQVTIPIAVILVPNIYWNLSITFQFYFQEGNNLSVICFTLHGLSASIATIFLYKPYRTFTSELFLKKVLRMEPKASSPIVAISNISIHHR